MRRAAALALAVACGCASRPSTPEPLAEPRVGAAEPALAADSAATLAELKSSGPALAYQAQSKLEGGDTIAAIEFLRRAIKASPAMATLDAGRRLGRLEELAADLELASDDRRAVFSQASGPAGRTSADAIRAYVEGRDIEAVLLASAAVGEDPQTQARRQLLASVSRRTGLEAPREQQLPRAALVQYKLQRAEKAYFDKRFGEAARECQEAAWLDPASALAWTRLGSAQWASGEPEKARAAFERALAIDPKNAELLKFMEAKGLLGRGRGAIAPRHASKE